MTEGAKTGTPRTDKAKANFLAWHKRDDEAALRGSHLDSDDPKPPDGWKVARIIERDLTEALKVAGEALGRLDMAADRERIHDPGLCLAIRERNREQRAALERIRNQSPS